LHAVVGSHGVSFSKKIERAFFLELYFSEPQA
jgi:hypothetical protein